MKLSSALFSVATLIVTLTASAKSFATNFETVTYSANMYVYASQTASFSLGERKYIKNIIVQAEGIYSDSVVEVMVNGNVKGTIYAPGRDPSYLVTIEDSADTIEFRHRSGSTLHIKALTATIAEPGPDFPPCPGGQMSNSALALAQEVIDIMVRLAPYSTLDDEQKNLLPIKIAAGQLKVMVEAHGFYSNQTAAAMDGLANTLQASDAYLTRLMESTALYDTSVELLSVKEKLRDLRQ